MVFGTDPEVTIANMSFPLPVKLFLSLENLSATLQRYLQFILGVYIPDLLFSRPLLVFFGDISLASYWLFFGTLLSNLVFGGELRQPIGVFR